MCLLDQKGQGYFTFLKKDLKEKKIQAMVMQLAPLACDTSAVAVKISSITLLWLFIGVDLKDKHEGSISTL